MPNKTIQEKIINPLIAIYKEMLETSPETAENLECIIIEVKTLCQTLKA